MKTKKSLDSLGLTPEEIKTIQSHARQEWEYVGYDLLRAVAEDTGKDINRVSIKRDEVIEIVCDAGRLEERLIRSKQAELAQKIKKFGMEEFELLLKPAFTFARYGM